MSTSNGSKSKHRKGRRDHHARRLPKPPVVQKKNEPTFLRDSAVTTKLLDYILDSPNGKRTLSRVARTCQALREPALDILWKDLDSFVPLLSQFPGHLLKKARKPGIGFVKTPTQEDWENVLKYADRVRQVTYNEEAGNIASSIFSMLEESRPRPLILPNLAELTWKVETPANLHHCAMFVNPELRALNLEVGGKAPNLTSFLSDVLRRTTLSSFSFASSTNLPDAFTNLLKRQGVLEQVSLVAPGALAPGIGRWVASLPQLKTLRLDLTGRSAITVEGFFDDLLSSGASTPRSTASTDSGVFSEDESDFSLIMSKSKKSFGSLRKLHLTGEVASISAFITRVNCPLTQLELAIEDPPEQADWIDLSRFICEKHGDTLQSLKISSSKHLGASRAWPREPGTGRLPLQGLTRLQRLNRLEIDLPESVIFSDADMESLAVACPHLKVLKLCPVAWVQSAPQITLDSLANLLVRCRRLYSIAAVVDARRCNPDILKTRRTSSMSLLRLHVGHSWIDDPLRVAIALSHIAPRLETLKCFQEKNRPGFVEAHARHWQTAAEFLPHFQDIRVLEQQLLSPVLPVEPDLPEMYDQSVGALVEMVEHDVDAVPVFCDAAVDNTVSSADQEVQAEPMVHSISIDATTTTTESSVNAVPEFADKEIDATPPKPPLIDTGVPSITKAIENLITPQTFRQPIIHRRPLPILFLPSLLNFLSFAYRFLVLYPVTLPTRIIRSASAQIPWNVSEPIKSQSSFESYVPSAGPEVMDIPLDSFSEVDP